MPSQEHHQDPAVLAEQERHAARHVTLGTYKIPLIAAVVIWVVYLFVPHAGDIPGWQVTFLTPAAHQAGIKVTESVYAVLMALGVGVLTTITLVTKNAKVALAAWLLSGMALMVSLLGLWLRQLDDASLPMGIGFPLSIVAVIVCVFCYAKIIMRRNPEQQRIAEQRASSDNLDEVGLAQRDAMGIHTDENPRFVDDRRRRAHERDKRA